MAKLQPHLARSLFPTRRCVQGLQLTRPQQQGCKPVHLQMKPQRPGGISAHTMVLQKLPAGPCSPMLACRFLVMVTGPQLHKPWDQGPATSICTFQLVGRAEGQPPGPHRLRSAPSNIPSCLPLHPFPPCSTKTPVVTMA